RRSVTRLWLLRLSSRWHAALTSSAVVSFSHLGAAGIFKRILGGFLDSDMVELGGVKAALKDVIDLAAQVFGAGNAFNKCRQGIQVSVVEDANNLTLYEAVQVGEITHHSSIWI